MPVTITAFDWVPDFAKGQVRDLRVRWALEEVGESYDVRYLAQGEQKSPSHRLLQPFGQVPTLEDGDVRLFESGGIVQHIAMTREGLFPSDPAGRARAIEWIFAALNTIEPPLMDRAIATLFEANESWSAPRLPAIDKRIRERLTEVSNRLDDRDWFDSAFSAGDLMMVSVLRNLDAQPPRDGSPTLAEFPSLAAYVTRGEARPAFGRALAAQMAAFTAKPPAGWREPTMGEKK